MKLEGIRDFVRLIEEYPRLELLSFREDSNSANSKLSKFYKILSESKIKRDEDAAFEIYGSASKTKYKFLKSHFTSRALNNLALIDLGNSGISERTQAIYKSYKNLFNVSILIRLGRREGAIALAKKTLPLTEKFELHHVSIELLEQLRMHALQIGNKKEFANFSDVLHHKIRLLESELTIGTLVNSIRVNFTKTIFIDEKYKPEAKKTLQRIRQLLKSNESYTGRIYYFRLLYLYSQIEGYPTKSLAACEEALSYMRRLPHMTSNPNLGEFTIYKLENYLLLKNFEKGMQAASECAVYYKTGTNNWFRYKDQEFLLLMQTLRFEEAFFVFREVILDIRFESLVDHLKERWEIFRLYIEYLDHPSNYVQSQKIIHVSPYSKDKRGFHVAVLILNILKLVELDDKVELIKQAETLSTYRFKYLSGKHSQQSFQLFKLINLLIDSDFNLQKIRKKVLRLEKIMAESVPTQTEIFECIQVLPPDWIWKKMKDTIDLFSK